jgi:hypothetical protein
VNRITFSLLDEQETGPYPATCMALYRVDRLLSEAAAWHYAKWRLPDESPYDVSGSASGSGGPAFFRATFELKSTLHPLRVKLAGASKGQIFLNGRNVGRYWLATQTGNKVPPQNEYDLPAPWLDTKSENELILFDEHGRPPTRAKLTYA